MTDVRAKYPQVAGNPRAMAMLCHALKARDKHADAYALGLAAIEQAPDDMEVRDRVRGVLSTGIQSYHVAMLQDEPRNRAYAEAITRAVRPGMHVFEIGTGAGLLSLIAARAGAIVTTCEADPTVAAAAAEIVRRNGLAERIRIIPKRSTDLDPGDLPEPPDLLVTEILGRTLFDEGIVPTLADARTRLLRPGTPMLPPRVELRCALVTLPAPPDRTLGTVEGFDLSAFNPLAPVPKVGARYAQAQPCSDPGSALAMDFETEDFGPTCERIGLVSRGARVDGVAQWLRIDFGEALVYENSPFEGPASHWGTPVKFLPKPIETEPGETVDVEWRLLDEKKLTVRIEARG